MILKQPDERGQDISKLEDLLSRTHRSIHAEINQKIRNLKAGIKAENQSKYYIDFAFKSHRDFYVLHDLRLIVNDRVAQFDHVIFHRSMNVYIVETKNFHAGFKVTSHSEFLRWDAFRKTYVAMNSPILQNERHVQVLKDAFNYIELPTWPLFGRIVPKVWSLIAVSEGAKIYRDKGVKTPNVVKVDAVPKYVEDHLLQNSNILKNVFPEEIEAVAKRIAAYHRPASHSYEDLYAAHILPEAPRTKTPPTVRSAGSSSSRLPESHGVQRTPEFASAIASTMSAAIIQNAPTAEVPSTCLDETEVSSPVDLDAIVPSEILDQPAEQIDTMSSLSSSEPVEQRSIACKHCSSPDAELLRGRMGFYVHCKACEQRSGFPKKCVCGGRLRATLKDSHLVNTCLTCSAETILLYHGVPALTEIPVSSAQFDDLKSMAAQEEEPFDPQTPNPSPDLSAKNCKHCGSFDVELFKGGFGYYLKCSPCGQNTGFPKKCECGGKLRSSFNETHLINICSSCARETHLFAYDVKSGVKTEKSQEASSVAAQPVS